MTNVYCKGTTPPGCGSYILSYEDSGYIKKIDCKIYVPHVSVEAYKESWFMYADKIEGYDF